jgi:hypothetical protein
MHYVRVLVAVAVAVAGIAGGAACEPPLAAPDAGLEIEDALSGPDAARDAPLPPCAATAVDVIRGRVADAAGTPVERARPQLCARLDPDDRLVCVTPPWTGADGRFEITVPPQVRCMRSAVMRVLVPNGPYATTYCPVDIGPTSMGSLEVSSPFELVSVERVALPPVGDPAMAREVSLGSALVLEVSPADVGGDADYARLGALRVDPLRSCVLAARELDGLIAASPEASLRAPFRVPGSGLPAGASVDLFVIGGLGTTLDDGTEVEEAALVRFGGGAVDSDGTITPEPGVRLPHLAWLGWAAR